MSNSIALGNVPPSQAVDTAGSSQPLQQQASQDQQPFAKGTVLIEELGGMVRDAAAKHQETERLIGECHQQAKRRHEEEIAEQPAKRPFLKRLLCRIPKVQFELVDVAAGDEAAEQEQLASLQQQLAESIKELDDLDRMRSITTDLVQAGKSASNALVALQQQQVTRQREREALEQQILQQQEELAEQRSSMQALDEELQLASGNMAAKERKVEALQGQLAALTSNGSTSNSQQLAEDNQDKEALQAPGAEGALQQQDSEVVAIDKQLTATRLEVEAVTRKLQQALDTSRTQGTVGTYAAKTDDAVKAVQEPTIEALLQKMVEVRKELNGLETALTLSKATVEALNTEKRRLIKQRDGGKEGQRSMDDSFRVTAIRGKIKELPGLWQDVQQELAAQRKTITVNDAQVHGRKQVNDLQPALAASRDKVQQLQQEAGRLRGAVLNLQQQLVQRQQQQWQQQQQQLFQWQQQQQVGHAAVHGMPPYHLLQLQQHQARAALNQRGQRRQY